MLERILYYAAIIIVILLIGYFVLEVIDRTQT
jgi:hypothetical protein